VSDTIVHKITTQEEHLTHHFPCHIVFYKL